MDRLKLSCAKNVGTSYIFLAITAVLREQLTVV